MSTNTTPSPFAFDCHHLKNVDEWKAVRIEESRRNIVQQMQQSRAAMIRQEAERLYANPGKGL